MSERRWTNQVTVGGTVTEAFPKSFKLRCGGAWTEPVSVTQYGGVEAGDEVTVWGSLVVRSGETVVQAHNITIHRKGDERELTVEAPEQPDLRGWAEKLMTIAQVLDEHEEHPHRRTVVEIIADIGECI